MGILEWILCSGFVAAAMWIIGYSAYMVERGTLEFDVTRWLISGMLLMMGTVALLACTGYFTPLYAALLGFLSQISASEMTAQITSFLISLILVSTAVTALIGLSYFAGYLIGKPSPKNAF